MNYGRHEVCDGLVCCDQSSFDTSAIVAQLSEHDNKLKNELKEICVNDGHKALHSLVRATEKYHVPDSKKDEIKLETECYENNAVKSGERANESKYEVEGDEEKEKHEKSKE